MRRRLVFIIKEEIDFGFKKHKKLEKLEILDIYDGQSAPKGKEDANPETHYYEDDAETMRSNKKQSRIRGRLSRVFGYFMGHITWPLVIVVAGGVILSVILG